MAFGRIAAAGGNAVLGLLGTVDFAGAERNLLAFPIRV
jgi:hypothetical protein